MKKQLLCLLTLPLIFMTNISAQQTPKDIKILLDKYEQQLMRLDDGYDTVYQEISNQIAQQQNNPANLAIWHSCMAGLLNTYYSQERWRILDRTPVEGPVTADINVWDIQTLVKQIVFHYRQSLRDEEHLTAIGVRFRML